MRVSVRREDPGYREDYRNVRILLDGKDVTGMCHTADEEEGRVYGYAMDLFGNKFVDPITDLPAEHVLYGRVEIVELVNGVSSNG